MDNDLLIEMIRVLDGIRTQLEANRLEQRAATITSVKVIRYAASFDNEAFLEITNAWSKADTMARDAYERAGR